MTLRHDAWMDNTLSNLINNIDLEEIRISNDLLNQSSEPSFDSRNAKNGRPPIIQTDSNHILFENFGGIESE